MAAEVNLKDYDAVVVQDLEVPSGSPAPESAGIQMAEKAVYQIKRYNEKYKLFDTIVKESGKGSKEALSGGKVLIITGEVKGYTVSSGTSDSYFAAHYKFIDKESGKVIYETDLRTSSVRVGMRQIFGIGARTFTSSNDPEYALHRNGEALAKVITKFKGK